MPTLEKLKARIHELKCGYSLPMEAYSSYSPTLADVLGAICETTNTALMPLHLNMYGELFIGDDSLASWKIDKPLDSQLPAVHEFLLSIVEKK